MEKRYCEHNGCMLPNNNYRFLWQFAYLFFGLAILLLKEENFTFFQIFLFVFPVFIDIAYNGLNSKVLNFARFIFGFMNLAIMGICVLGLSGVLTDLGNSIDWNLAVITFSGSIKKSKIAWAMAPNLMVPLIYFGCSHCKNNEGMLAFLHSNNHRKVNQQ